MKLYEVKLLIESESEESVKKTLKDLCLNYTSISIAQSHRTLQQNAALHLFFTQLAEELNEKGFDMRTLIRPEIELSWTPYNVKQYLWKPLQEKLLGKKSTTKLNKTEDINLVYDNLNRILIERTKGEINFIPFPSLDSLIDESKNL